MSVVKVVSISNLLVIVGRCHLHSKINSIRLER